VKPEEQSARKWIFVWGCRCESREEVCRDMVEPVALKEVLVDMYQEFWFKDLEGRGR
jgi:hypothetical protein